MFCLVTRRFAAAVLIALTLVSPAFCLDAKAPKAAKVPSNAAPALGGKPQAQAVSAILMDVDTGCILYAKNPHQRLPNASTTKIMTAILLIEHSKLTDTVKVSKKASETPNTSINLRAGEEISVKDLLMGLMVRSANDAAVVIAEHVAGDAAEFEKMMNRKAQSIGCKDTHFISPNGLYVPGHYTTAYDLCLMARYAFRYPCFNEAISTKKHFLRSRTVNREDLAVFTHSRFLKDYPGADGVKSGYTRQAKRCFVGSATRDGWRLLSAVLGSPNAGEDTVALMDYGFGQFQLCSIASEGQKCADASIDGAWHATVPAVAEKALRVPVPKKGAAVTTRTELVAVRAPIEKGAKLGKLKVLVNGKEVAAVGLVASEADGISLGRRLLIAAKWVGIIAVCVVGGLYVGTIAKGARGRRSRVSPPVRKYSRGRQGRG